MSSHSDWRRLGRSLVQPCSQSRVSTEFTPGHLGFSLIRSFRTSNSLVLWDPFFPSFISVMRLCFPPPCISSGNLPCFSLSLCLMICISLKKLSFFNTFQCVKGLLRLLLSSMKSSSPVLCSSVHLRPAFQSLTILVVLYWIY